MASWLDDSPFETPELDVVAEPISIRFVLAVAAICAALAAVVLLVVFA